MAPGVHAYVDTHRNCEDIAMAFLVANLTGAPPEYVRAPALQDLGQGIFKASPRDENLTALESCCPVRWKFAK